MIICDFENKFKTGNIPRNVEYNAVKARGGSKKEQVLLSFTVDGKKFIPGATKGGFSVRNLIALNKIGSILLLLISLIVSYGLINSTMFSTIGGIFLLIISITFAVLFWVYSIKLKESRC